MEQSKWLNSESLSTLISNRILHITSILVNHSYAFLVALVWRSDEHSGARNGALSVF